MGDQPPWDLTPDSARRNPRGPAKGPVYEEMRRLERKCEEQHGRRPTSRELADGLLEKGRILDYELRRPSPAEFRDELEQAILTIPPETERERQAVKDLRLVHALHPSRRIARSKFEARTGDFPIEPSVRQRRRALTIINRRRRRKTYEADAYYKAVGKLPEQIQHDPVGAESTIRDWQRMKRSAEEREAEEAELFRAGIGRLVVLGDGRLSFRYDPANPHARSEP